MNITLLKENGINYEEGLNRFIGRSDIFEKYLVLFCNGTEIEDVKKSFSEKDYKGLLESTHSLKGVTGNLSISSLYKLYCEIVALIRNEEYEKIPECYERVVNEHERICKIILEAAK